MFTPGVRTFLELSPEEFLAMRAEHPEEVKSVEVLPPILGKTKGFGGVRVHLDSPRYEVVF
jgi:hypothetical protein